MWKRVLFIVSSLVLLSLVLYAYRTSTRGLEKEPLQVVPENNLASEENEVKKLKITSTAFKNEESIPSHHTCDGDDLSPPLQFADAPADAKSLALIVDDPDAPAKTWVHWIVYNIAPDTAEISEDTLPENALEGMTDFQSIGYGGPCPSSGTHRYFFKLYALDTVLDLEEGITKEDLLSEMEGHIIDQAELVGLYQRN